MREGPLVSWGQAEGELTEPSEAGVSAHLASARHDLMGDQALERALSWPCPLPGPAFPRLQQLQTAHCTGDAFQPGKVKDVLLRNPVMAGLVISVAS